jgi:hypothetical protein
MSLAFLTCRPGYGAYYMDPAASQEYSINLYSLKNILPADSTFQDQYEKPKGV